MVSPAGPKYLFPVGTHCSEYSNSYGGMLFWRIEPGTRQGRSETPVLHGGCFGGESGPRMQDSRALPWCPSALRTGSKKRGI